MTMSLNKLQGSGHRIQDSLCICDIAQIHPKACNSSYLSEHEAGVILKMLDIRIEELTETYNKIGKQIE